VGHIAIRRWGRDVPMGESWDHQVDNLSIVDIEPPCSIRQHKSAYVRILCIRQHTCPRALGAACRMSIGRHGRRTRRRLRLLFSTGRERTGRSLALHGIRQHTSVSIRQHTSAELRISWCTHTITREWRVQNKSLLRLFQAQHIVSGAAQVREWS
jgi:hypothetical protein